MIHKFRSTHTGWPNACLRCDKEISYIIKQLKLKFVYSAETEDKDELMFAIAWHHAIKWRTFEKIISKHDKCISDDELSVKQIIE